MPFDDSDGVADETIDLLEEGTADVDEPADEPVDAEEPEDDLSDLDDAVRARVDAYTARQAEQQRARLNEFGLDLSQDGRPLVSDQQKLSGWAAPPAPRYEPQQPASQAQQPQAQQPQAQQQAEEEPVFDPLAADVNAYNAWAERIAEKAAQKAAGPLLQEIQRLQGLSQRRAESEAMSRVRDVVQQRIPEMSAYLDHPDFDAGYRAEIAKVPAEYLDDPKTVASIAALVRTGLDSARMPARRTDPQAAQQALNQANRAGLGQTPSANRGASGARDQGPDPNVQWGVRYLERSHAQMDAGRAARLEASPESWSELAHEDYDSWLAARTARLARNQRGGVTRGRR